MNRLARCALVATALAPILVVHALSLCVIHPLRALLFLLIALGLVGICWCLLTLARRHLQHNTLEISRWSNVDRDILVFVVTYLLPLFTQSPADLDYRTLLGVLVLIGAMVYQSGMYHVNPLLGLFGYHFHQIDHPGGGTYLLLTQDDLLGHASLSAPQPGAGGGVRLRITAVRLGPNLWLEVRP